MQTLHICLKRHPENNQSFKWYSVSTYLLSQRELLAELGFLHTLFSHWTVADIESGDESHAFSHFNYLAIVIIIVHVQSVHLTYIGILNRRKCTLFICVTHIQQF